MYRYLQRKYSSRKIIVQMAGDIMLGLNKVGWEGSVFYTILQGGCEQEAYFKMKDIA